MSNDLAEGTDNASVDRWVDHEEDLLNLEQDTVQSACSTEDFVFVCGEGVATTLGTGAERAAFRVALSLRGTWTLARRRWCTARFTRDPLVDCKPC